jgi:LAO/AO transport system kinase
MKAGIMEIADVLVVNKSDLPNADLLARQLASIVHAAPEERRTPILRTAGGLNEGVEALVDALEEHHAYIAQAGVREKHRRAQARHQVLALARQRLIDRVVSEHGTDGRLGDLVERVAAHEIDPHTAADMLIGA